MVQSLLLFQFASMFISCISLAIDEYDDETLNG